MSRCGFWAGWRRGMQTHALGVYVALSIYMGWAFSLGCESPTNSTSACTLSVWTSGDAAPERCSQFQLIFALPRSRRSWCGLSESLCSSSAVSWALTSSSPAFGVVVLTQIIWDISWQPKFTHSAAPGPAVLICVSLCMPQACLCLLGNASCLAVRGSGWNCANPSKERKKFTFFFGWARKLWGNHRYCSVSAQSLCCWGLEPWPDPVYEDISGFLPNSSGALLTWHK